MAERDNNLSLVLVFSELVGFTSETFMLRRYKSYQIYVSGEIYASCFLRF